MIRRMSGAGMRRVRGGSGGPLGELTLEQQVAALAPLAWFRPDSGVTIATGISSLVSRVNGHTVVQATGAKQPAYTATDADFANQPSMTFASASSQELTQASSALAALLDDAASYTVAWVGKRTAAGAGHAICGWGRSSAATHFVYHGFNGSNFQTLQRNGGSTVSNTGTTSVTTAVHQCSASFDGSLYDTRTQKAVDLTDSANAQVPTACDLFAIGALPRSSYANYHNGKIADLIIFPLLTAGQITTVEAYFTDRYGV